MPIVVGGKSARFTRRKGDIRASFQYVNDEPAMCMFPAVKRMQSGAFIICESAAYQYTNERYLLSQAMKAGRVMGMDDTKHTVVRIADCILLWLDDLLMMPPNPEDMVERAAGEATVAINGKSHTFEVPG